MNNNNDNNINNNKQLYLGTVVPLICNKAVYKTIDEKMITMIAVQKFKTDLKVL